MGFFMGMFVGGSVTLLHAGMAGGLKGLDRMAFKRSANSHSDAVEHSGTTIVQMLALGNEAHSLTAAAVRVICLLSSERSAEARHSASSSLSDLSCDRTKRASREPPRRSLLGRLVQFCSIPTQRVQFHCFTSSLLSRISDRIGDNRRARCCKRASIRQEPGDEGSWS